MIGTVPGEAMISPALHPDESFRLAALRDLAVLDSAPEERFDRLTRIAQKMFGVRAALIGLVDSDRVWFKSRSSRGRRTIPRRLSFCGHTILGDDLLFVSDARRDPRFGDNPMVTAKSGILFYAGAPLRGTGGAPVGSFCLIDSRPRRLSPGSRSLLQDIAGAAESELQRTGRQGAEVLDLLERCGEITLTFDPRGRIRWMNPVFEEVLGYRKAELLGRPLTLFIHPDDRAAAQARLRRVGGPQALESRFLARDGRCRWLSWMVSRRWASDPNAYILAREVSGCIEARRDLRRERDDAVRSMREKGRLLADMSHELRTPLTTIIGMTGMMSDSSMDGEQKEYVEVIARSGERLLSVINDILDFSKLEAGKLCLQSGPFRPSEIIRDAAKICASQAEKKGLELKVEDAIPKDLLVLGDPNRLEQVLINLLGNAVKHTERGRIALQASILRSDEDIRIQFAVSDQGDGLPSGTERTVFEPYVQAGISSEGGTGLGLAIAKQIIGLMNGDSGVINRPGEGATFWFSIPLQSASPTRASAAKEAPPLRMLILDPIPERRRDLSRRLVAAGMIPFELSDPGKALDLLEQRMASAAPIRFVLLHSDLHGPSALDLAREISREPLLSEVLPLIISPNAKNLDLAQVAEAGVAGWVKEPVDLRGFRRRLQDLARVRCRKTAARGLNRPEASRKAFRILLVEDDRDTRRAILLTLEHLGYRADAVRTGTEAIRALKKFPYSLVLLDCRLPGADGFEVIREIRHGETPGTRLPVIALTASVQPENRAHCFSAGMDDFLPKPLRPAELAAALAKWDMPLVPSTPGGASRKSAGRSAPTAALAEGQRLVREIVDCAGKGRPKPLRHCARALLAVSQRINARALSGLCKDLASASGKKDRRSRRCQAALIAEEWRLIQGAAEKEPRC